MLTSPHAEQPSVRRETSEEKFNRIFTAYNVSSPRAEDVVELGVCYRG